MLLVHKGVIVSEADLVGAANFHDFHADWIGGFYAWTAERPDYTIQS